MKQSTLEISKHSQRTEHLALLRASEALNKHKLKVTGFTNGMDVLLLINLLLSFNGVDDGRFPELLMLTPATWMQVLDVNTFFFSPQESSEHSLGFTKNMHEPITTAEYLFLKWANTNVAMVEQIPTINVLWSQFKVQIGGSSHKVKELKKGQCCGLLSHSKLQKKSVRL